MSLFRQFNVQLSVPVVVLGLLLVSYNPLIAGSTPGHSASVKGSGWLGVSIQDISDEIREATGLETDRGVLVNEVFEDTPAEKGGLKAGDVLQKFNDTEIEEVGQFVDLVRASKAGDEVELTLLRDNSEKEIRVEIGERPEERHLEMFGEGGPHTFKFKDFEPFSHSFNLPTGGYIGVKIQDLNPQLADAFGLKKDEGALVIEAEEDGPAYEAGIRGGDVIVKVGDDDIADTRGLKTIIWEKEEGDEVKITVLRKKKRKTFDVTVGESPGFSSLERIKMLDLGDELEGLKDFRVEIYSDIEEEVAKLREELKELKNEFNEMRKEKE